MKVFTISHSAVVAGYHARYLEIIRQADVALTLLAPRKWLQFNRLVALEKTSDPNYRIIARQPIVWDLKNHGLRNVTHVYPGMKKLLEQVQPDIIELWEEPFAAVSFQVIRAAKRLLPESRIIFFSAQNIRKNYPPPFCWFERYTYRQADFAFVINREAESIIRNKGWNKDTLVLPLGVAPHVFRPIDASALRSELGLNKFTVGFIGKLEKQKGILDLIRAAGRLKDEINLLLIGGGPLRDETRQLVAKLGLTGKTRFISSVPYDKMPAYLNCLDVLVLPSITLPGLKEQFGRVLVEAMSCGIPIIGSDSGEIPRVIGDAGLVFPEGHYRELAEKIELLRRDSARRKDLAERGRARVWDNYSWEKIAAKQVAVYRRLLQGKN
jgi:glycosyltransferase involved in cell wall biosynthesis